MVESDTFCLVFGTSAAPIHAGHIELIVDAVHAIERRSHQVDEVVILPVYRRHNISEETKQALQETFEDRLALCQIAAREITATLNKPADWVEVSRLEEALALETGKPNYTAESMAVMRAELDPKIRLSFLIGTDILSGEPPNLSRWYELNALLATTTFVVCPREGYPLNSGFMNELEQRGGKVIYFEEVRIADVSSSEIRVRLIETNDPAEVVRAGWVSQEAFDYILDHHLIERWRTQL
ncbi:MAG: nicotinate-nicotinamide nucleotide adenylyltransferase [Anaerolineaceae bacterium]